MSRGNVDLAGIFQVVTQALAANQETLNQSDEINQDHGDNMVQTFRTITQALQEKKTVPDDAALAYAAQQLLKNTSSGSGKMYAENLLRASDQFQNKSIDAQGALQLLQTLIGSQAQQPAQPQDSGMDMLGTLLGGLTGAQTDGQSTSSQDAGADMLGTLLGGLTGAQTSNQSSSSAGGDLLSALLGGAAGGDTSQSTGQNGLDAGDLINAGLAFLAAKQSGGSNAQALVQAFMAGSGMGGAKHRQESTQIVVNAFLQGLNTLVGSKAQ